MATYPTLRSGSSGSVVKKLQQALSDAGYNVGSIDGIYGAKTEAAVRKYQADNGLSSDGIAGEKTLTSLYSTPKKITSMPSSNKPSAIDKIEVDTGSGSGSASNGSGSGSTGAPNYSAYEYDPSGNKAYMEALAALQAAQKDKPNYAGTYDAQLEEIYNNIINRDKFSYDLNGDALYQQYKDQYTLNGQMAMMNTMGQAAALTGGYGNSYASTVGNQAYQAYLQQLNDVVPELYGLALDQYNAEGDRLMEQYAMVGDMRDTEYGRYQDALDQYWKNVSLMQSQADEAYDRGYENWYNAYQMGVDAENTAYQKQQDAYDRLAELIVSSGYSPSADELAAAGMTSAQANGYRNVYTQNQAASGSSGSGGGYSGSSRSSSSKSSSSTSSSKSSTSSGKISKAKSVDYSSWDASMWESFFAGYRNNKNYGPAYAQNLLKKFISEGKIPKSMIYYASIGARGSLGH